MCTAVTYRTKDFYFGRTLDYEYSYAEKVTVTPRGYPFRFRDTDTPQKRFAMIGMAFVQNDFPLYYDAVNEKGLGMAALNFPGYACYSDPVQGRENVAVFEFIPWVLSQCQSVAQARMMIGKVNLLKESFSPELLTTPLHWLIADKNEAITVEAVEGGIRLYDNPVGVLTNNPPFAGQLFRLNDYMRLSRKTPENRFAPALPLEAYSRGMGALGLPGDLSSQSRFVRAAFVKMNSVSGDSEEESVSQFFHILGAVEQQRGCCDVGEGEYEITIYTSCCNADKGVYYYTTYGNHQITAVDMHRCDLDGKTLFCYPLITQQQIRLQN